MLFCFYGSLKKKDLITIASCSAHPADRPSNVVTFPCVFLFLGTSSLIKRAGVFAFSKRTAHFRHRGRAPPSLPTLNAEFGREETKHDRLPEKQNLKTLEILP